MLSDIDYVETGGGKIISQIRDPAKGTEQSGRTKVEFGFVVWADKPQRPVKDPVAVVTAQLFELFCAHP